MKCFICSKEIANPEGFDYPGYIALPLTCARKGWDQNNLCCKECKENFVIPARLADVKLAKYGVRISNIEIMDSFSFNLKFSEYNPEFQSNEVEEAEDSGL